MGSAVDWSQRPTYSPEQIGKYFDRIKFPTESRQSPVVLAGANGDNERALSFLKVLQRYQVAAVPFENLDLHYSVHRQLSIDVQKLFEKIVDGTSERGGYCMENNTVFGTVLRSLGYQVTSVGGRVNEAAQPISASKNWRGPKYDGWNHMVNLVTIGEQKYLVDVGFGSNGPHQPVPLSPDVEFHNVGEQSGRLRYGSITQHTSSTQRLWQYEIQNSGADWIPAYCFTETEFIPEDFTMMNYYMSTSRDSWFTFSVVCVRMLLDDTGESLVGDLTLFNSSLKRRIGATAEHIQTFSSDEERVAALAKTFNIHIGLADRESIRRTISEIL
ncbi:N-acetyltransferase family protein [Penicillium chermesinum]|uniref:N-acetyltransferase family protein n=1 Tax=Penicillium chermesinum TaxID=63820 RepID=A0A9W9TE60_9EURO|nr:N-acetyltransferase family protein [Penicillium chermesinum]KAJ5219527.1 N-acetyltransferase family protein [Penicillium chermesinum]KAJ6153547.1 N-acetyltransferase family protein [Penicillium chermesinum]